MSIIQLVDNTNSAILYNNEWESVQEINAVGGTEQLTRSAGASAIFTFRGNGVKVFGHQGDGGPNNDPMAHSQYSIDGGPPTDYTIPQGISGQQFAIQFYTSPELPFGNHTLHITNLINNSWYYLDFLTIDLGNNSPSETVGRSSPAPSSTFQVSFPSSYSSPITPSNSAPQLAGITVGGVVFGLILALAILWCTGKRRSPNKGHPTTFKNTPAETSDHPERGLTTQTGPLVIEPFLLPPASISTPDGGAGVKPLPPPSSMRDISGSTSQIPAGSSGDPRPDVSPDPSGSRDIRRSMSTGSDSLREVGRPPAYTEPGP
ncbi:hypothetical protein M422DRAFT_69614 [Sphaerobolus stellatus SS14]|uniref:Uncharacterized protein n=1 Tax=Sphaerobolus stellatus (strain SS14) TaxID=990650 RepID=A0A0C9U1P7_SPHS4|nr:hypothetical protein M422DRAFT_34102 [Sphaerobolus stellatus SS14]KIJ36738.1 hypothetical protein M422DRAFT_69614 [Sphaerobolus stellatus SS14]